MNRNELVDLRPHIPSAETEGTKSLEHFQNEVLRPIIKFQHDFILAYFQNHPHFHKIISEKGTRIAFQEKINHFIGDQVNVKNQLIGSVIGLMVEKELKFYFLNATEINKRIFHIICQRVSDTFY